MQNNSMWFLWIEFPGNEYMYIIIICIYFFLFIKHTLHTIVWYVGGVNTDYILCDSVRVDLCLMFCFADMRLFALKTEQIPQQCFFAVWMQSFVEECNYITYNEIRNSIIIMNRYYIFLRKYTFWWFGQNYGLVKLKRCVHDAW